MTRPDAQRGRPHGVLIALAFFALGILAARLLGVLTPENPSNEPQPPPASAQPDERVPLFPPKDAGGPRVVIDPSSISLLPDASLEIKLPDAPDAGALAP